MERIQILIKKGYIMSEEYFHKAAEEYADAESQKKALEAINGNLDDWDTYWEVLFSSFWDYYWEKYWAIRSQASLFL